MKRGKGTQRQRMALRAEMHGIRGAFSEEPSQSQQSDLGEVQTGEEAPAQSFHCASLQKWGLKSPSSWLLDVNVLAPGMSIVSSRSSIPMFAFIQFVNDCSPVMWLPESNTLSLLFTLSA
ncbi:hypothetical protein UY3_00811 [Chelonia mydas]|uniref:Uncharacterized protein n=1 Tax=Chelonia mydas TaxID=8469 RepID=M7C1D0_CHEMY|nr:hypothetical protein UY3_00811 [Chelonia mydas]